MPNRTRLHLQELSEAEREVAYRAMGNAHKIQNGIRKGLTSDPQNVARAKALIERFESEHEAYLVRQEVANESKGFRDSSFGSLVRKTKRFFKIYPSLAARKEFMILLAKSPIGLNYFKARQAYKDLIDHPGMMKALFEMPIDFRREQKPKMWIKGCMDTRFPPSEIFSSSLGSVLQHTNAGTSPEDITDPTHMSPRDVADLAYAVDHAGVRLVGIMGHRNCGGIKAAAHGIDLPEPEHFSDKAIWQIAQAKREVFNRVDKDGEAKYLSMLDQKDVSRDAQDRKLQALELANIIVATEMVSDVVAKLKNGKDTTVFGFYGCLSDEGYTPYLLTKTGSKDGQWRAIRLETSQTQLPCTHKMAVPANDNSPEASSGRYKPICKCARPALLGTRRTKTASNG